MAHNVPSLLPQLYKVMKAEAKKGKNDFFTTYFPAFTAPASDPSGSLQAARALVMTSPVSARLLARLQEGTAGAGPSGSQRRRAPKTGKPRERQAQNLYVSEYMAEYGGGSDKMAEAMARWGALGEAKQQHFMAQVTALNAVERAQAEKEEADA